MTISREVKDVFDRCAKAVVKIDATDQHGDLSGTGFFVDPTGTLYTAYSVGGEAENINVEFKGKKYPAHQLMADLRSGIAMLKVDLASPALPIGNSDQLEIATPVVTIGYPLDLSETPSFGMIAGFDRKCIGGYFPTRHLRVNLPPQRGEGGAPLLNLKGRGRRNSALQLRKQFLLRVADRGCGKTSQRLCSLWRASVWLDWDQRSRSCCGDRGLASCDDKGDEGHAGRRSWSQAGRRGSSNWSDKGA